MQFFSGILDEGMGGNTIRIMKSARTICFVVPTIRNGSDLISLRIFQLFPNAMCLLCLLF